MRYSELKREIKKASKEQKESGIIHYIAYWGKGVVSNFIDDLKVSDDQLIRAMNEGLLVSDDSDVLEVI